MECSEGPPHKSASRRLSSWTFGSHFPEVGLSIRAVQSSAGRR
jgi:hypothetical protein